MLVGFYLVTLSYCSPLQQEKTLRAPTGCPAPPTLSQPWFRRSLSLSQHDPVLPPQTGISGPRFNSMSQEHSFLEPRKFERTLSMPHRVQRPIHLHASRLSSMDEPSDSGTTVSIRQSAFKQLSPVVQLQLATAQEHPQISAKNLGISNFVCERGEVKLSSLPPTELETVCSELAAPSCSILKLE